MQFLAEVLVDFEIEEYIVYSNKHIYIYIERERADYGLNKIQSNSIIIVISV
jgi:hypothetical protein